MEKGKPNQDESPPPTYTAVGSRPPFNLGLHILSRLDQVTIQQTPDLVSLTSSVTTRDNELIFQVKEDASPLVVELAGTDRPFNIGLYDEREQLAITLKRDPKIFRKKKVQVFVGEELVSKVRLKRAFFGRLLHINNVEDKPVFIVTGPLMRWKTYTFKILSVEGNPIGSIKRKWRGIGNELFTEAEEYQLTFPQDLDVRYKAAVIAACLLIDIHYYTKYFGDSI